MGRVKTFVREEVLDKAIQLFWEKGLADTSLADLEKATGVNKSGLYSEFKDKEDIYHEAVKRYRDTHVGYKLLDVAPYGWDNIEKFMKSNMACKGMKGCLFTNSIREVCSIPAKTFRLMSDQGDLVQELMVKNLKAAGVKKNVDVVANMTMSFINGIALKLNVVKPEELVDEVDSFLAMIKSSSQS